MPTAISLFTGCGGSDTGVIQAGFDVIMANDVLPYAKATYLANLQETDYLVKNIELVKNFPKADLLIGCYPCQGFSQGGVRDPKRKINYLYLEFARALGQIKPKAFIVENVSGMYRSNFRYLLDHQVSVFTEAGYDVSYAILNASDFGVAQNRKRLFLVGIKRNFGFNYKFPEATHGTECVPKTTIREALKGMSDWPDGEFYDKPFHWYYLSRNRRRDWTDISNTIVSNPRHIPLHPMSPQLIKLASNEWVFETEAPARRFSYYEAARLQGFPQSFKFQDCDSLTNRYKIVGNAVPPALFRAVSASLPQELWV